MSSTNYINLEPFYELLLEPHSPPPLSGMEYPPAYPITLSGCAHFLREVGTDNSINFQRKKHLLGTYQLLLRQIFRFREVIGYADSVLLKFFTTLTRTKIIIMTKILILFEN